MFEREEQANRESSGLLSVAQFFMEASRTTCPSRTSACPAGFDPFLPFEVRELKSYMPPSILFPVFHPLWLSLPSSNFQQLRGLVPNSRHCNNGLLLRGTAVHRSHGGGHHWSCTLSALPGILPPDASPSIQIPGTKTRRPHQIYELYYDVVAQSQFTFQLQKLHNEYGPIVRIAPQELHIEDSSYFDEFYSLKA
ncbi:hypothetical protein N431DRAFT_520311 [Stipitochalara longipes BDJ]|nr:hypothetical protein N431DRAFT_520311 [Stipitochalara longipes BDJ]